MFGVTRNSKISEDKDKNSATNEKDSESTHNQSSPLLTNVATTNNTINDIMPDTKTSTLNDEPGIKGPTTNAPNTSFPISYNAFASSSRWDFRKIIINASLSYGENVVKGSREKRRKD